MMTASVSHHHVERHNKINLCFYGRFAVMYIGKNTNYDFPTVALESHGYY